LQGKDMGFKNMDRKISLADLILKYSLDKNRCLKRLSGISGPIDWDRINSVLIDHYRIGTSCEGADTYPPILLDKCLLLQKWLHIDSDPKLESQINDRISFKKFL
jgi:IS5 family transposase